MDSSNSVVWEIAVESGPQADEKRQRPATGSGFHALLVGSGILLSRIAGLIRQRVFAHYFGASAAADAFSAAFRIPNILQNLFGEGALSASFIPVYASLLARGERKEADRVAGAVFALLSLAVAGLVLLGVLFTPVFLPLLVPGFHGETRDLTERLVRILFPGAGLLVLSAWCLGVLNSHRRFLLSYTAPVLWNAAMIAALLAFGPGRPQFRLAEILAWASVAGSGLQVAVQLPVVLRLARDLRLELEMRSSPVRTVIRNFLPVCLTRGTVQISGYVDGLLATLLPVGAVATMTYAQILYTLPVSLFGIAVAAAELPAMSSDTGGVDAVAASMRARLEAGLRRIAFFIVPSAVAFLALGDLIAGALFQTGRLTRADTLWIWGVLAGYSVGLLALTMGRLYSSAFYALRNTRTPLRFALVHVLVATVLGALLALLVPPLLGIDRRWGLAGLALSAGVAGWIEFLLLRRALGREIGPTGVAQSFLVRLIAAALVSAALAWGVRLLLGPTHPIAAAAAVLTVYGAAYLLITTWMGVTEGQWILRRLRFRSR